MVTSKNGSNYVDCQSGTWVAIGGGGLGYGQTFQNVLASRVSGVTYTNNTGKPIWIIVSQSGTTTANLAFYINGNLVSIPSSIAWTTDVTVSGIIPIGGTYRIVAYNTINRWYELR